MSAVLQGYDTHFRPGTRVRIGVPLADRSTFQEWAQVASLEGEVLEVDLSRDSLPAQAKMEAGSIVQVGLLDRQRGLGCQGEIVDWRKRRRLVLRLAGELADFEPREFFREDITLPLELRLPPSQFSQEIKEHWRQSRWAIEFAGQEPDPGESVELSLLREELQSRLERRKAAAPVDANVSGNGMRLDLAERLNPGMLVELGIYLPQPDKVLEVVGEVVQVTTSAKSDGFSTALHYRFIDEADRDRLVGYIASQQMWKLSQQPPKVEAQGPSRRPKAVQSPLRITLGVLIISVLLLWEIHSILAGNERGEKHEIAKVFEAGIMDMLRQRR